jgi:hypothetical protein
MKTEFKPPSTRLNIASRSEWEMPPTDSILQILNQPFTYLARGNQATVFTSADGQHVLKLFRYRRPRFPISHAIKSWFAKRHRKKPKHDLFSKMDKTLSAAHLAFTEASPFTQVLFCHLNPTRGQLPIVQLQARRSFSLPLDSYRFVLQKRVTPFKTALLAAKEDPAKFQRLVDSFVQLIVDRSALGISNSDPNLSPNFGFLGEQAVETDFGNYQPFHNPQERAAEIARYFLRFEHWLEKNAPEYTAYLSTRKHIALNNL